MNTNPMQLITGFILGFLIAILAWRLKALDRSGAWAAVLSGGIIFGLGGFAWAVLLLTFFISSSALSRAFAGRKSTLSEKFSKGGQRDWAQVLANGGLGAVLAVLHTLFPENPLPFIGFAGAMGAVNADTWSTELGVLNPSPPRLITNGKMVECGTSGGISVLGSLSALGGAALVGVPAALFSAAESTLWGHTPRVGLALMPAVVIGGVVGAFFDSLLGATVQGIYYCPACKKATERHPQHLCGSETNLLRGWRWLNNDVVNFFASLIGALVAVAIWEVMS
jgi:uncharacterized protein (TIGR00297 family)